MPLIILLVGYIAWIVIQRKKYVQQQKEDEMWRMLGESMERKEKEKERLKNSYTIDD